MNHRSVVEGLSVPVAVGLLLLVGCSGQRPPIPMDLAPKPPVNGSPLPQMVKASVGPRVTVVPFEDGRADQSRIGSRVSMWGGEDPFSVANGTAGEATAQAFAEYLKRQGWQAQYAKSAAAAAEKAPDVVLSGKILDLAVEAKKGFMMTDIEAKSKLQIQAKNREDESSLTRTDAHSGSHDNILWFDAKDGEDILSEVLEKNFERFVAHTKFEDRALRLR